MDRNEMNNVVKLALDAIHGRIQGNFSKEDASETLRKAFIEANGGSTTINIKTFHRGNQLFDIIEELLPVIIQEGLQGDETITVDLTNRFTDRSSTVGGDGDSGSQTGLKPGMTYTLTLRDGSHVLSSVTVETQREVETFFHFEGGECTCLIDGMFHFSAEIIDGGVQHGFTATLTDWYGNVSTATIDPEAGEYSLPVTGAGLLGDTAVLRITCIQDLEDGGTELVVLHESEYTI